VQVLPVGTGAKAVGRYRRRLAVELADGLTHGPVRLSQVGNPLALNQRKARDLVLHEGHAACHQPSASVLDHQAGPVEGRVRRMAKDHGGGGHQAHRRQQAPEKTELTQVRRSDLRTRSPTTTSAKPSARGSAG